MRKNKCVNPKIGEHPDLFERDEEGKPKMTAVRSGPLVVGGAYVEGMSRAQVRALPRDAFNEEEWNSLDADDQECILENDPESLARVKELVDAFVEREKRLLEPDEITKQQWIESGSDYFAQWLGEQDEIIDHRGIQEEVEQLTDKLMPEGGESPSPDEVRGAINEALRDADNYDFHISGNEYSREGIFRESVSDHGGIYFDKRDLANLTDPMFADEIEEAVKQINNNTYLRIKFDDLFPKYEFQIDYGDIGYYFVADVNWDKVEAAARETLGEELIEEAATPPEERIVYRFKDGFYVVDLLSSELKAEGSALGICVGDTQYGYAGAVKRGDTKIFSLRRPSGKPLFTIEAQMHNQDVERVRQIKGKGDRLPGWDRDKVKVGGYDAMKKDEVLKALEFLAFLEVDPWEVGDIRPALEATYAAKRLKTPDQVKQDKMLEEIFGAAGGERENPRRRRNSDNDRPLGFDSPWTP